MFCVGIPVFTFKIPFGIATAFLVIDRLTTVLLAGNIHLAMVFGT